MGTVTHWMPLPKPPTNKAICRDCRHWKHCENGDYGWCDTTWLVSYMDFSCGKHEEIDESGPSSLPNDKKPTCETCKHWNIAEEAMYKTCGLKTEIDGYKHICAKDYSCDRYEKPACETCKHWSVVDGVMHEICRLRTCRDGNRHYCAKGYCCDEYEACLPKTHSCSDCIHRAHSGIYCAFTGYYKNGRCEKYEKESTPTEVRECGNCRHWRHDIFGCTSGEPLGYCVSLGYRNEMEENCVETARSHSCGWWTPLNVTVDSVKVYHRCLTREDVEEIARQTLLDSLPRWWRSSSS